jgi:hypothetical protein
MYARLILTFLMLFSALPTIAQQNPVEVIPLNHALPEDLIPSLRPFLDDGDRITGHGNKLIIRTSEERLGQIKTLIAELDKPLRQLLISIKTGNDATNSKATTIIKSTITKDNVIITNSGSRPHKNDNNQTTVRVNRQYGTRGGQSTQQVRALEGKPVYISEGQLVPLLSGGGYFLPGVEYHDIASGFIATTRVNGNNVRVAISRHNDQLKNGEIKTGAIDTTVVGQLGQWLLIGGIDDAQDSDTRGTGRYRSSRSSQSSQTWIKIELE